MNPDTEPCDMCDKQGYCDDGWVEVGDELESALVHCSCPCHGWGKLPEGEG